MGNEVDAPLVHEVSCGPAGVRAGIVLMEKPPCCDLLWSLSLQMLDKLCQDLNVQLTVDSLASDKCVVDDPLLIKEGHEHWLFHTWNTTFAFLGGGDPTGILYLYCSLLSGVL